MLTIILSTLIAASELGVTVERFPWRRSVSCPCQQDHRPRRSRSRAIGSRRSTRNRSTPRPAWPTPFRASPSRFFPMVIERDGVASTHATMLPISGEQPIRYASAEERPM